MNAQIQPLLELSDALRTEPDVDGIEFWSVTAERDVRFARAHGPVDALPRISATLIINVVIAGHYAVRTEHSELVAGPGSIVLIGADTRCQCWSWADDTPLVHAALFTPAFAARAIGVAAELALRGQVLHGADLELASWIETLHAICPPQRPGDLPRAFGAELAELVRAATSPGRLVQAPRLAPRPQPSEAIRRAHALLARRFLETQSLSDVAQECGISEEHLIRSFKACYWLTPHQFCMTQRVNYGRSLLDAGLAIADAAHAAGFSDQSHFHRWFTRCYLVSPGRYRAAVIGPDGPRAPVSPVRAGTARPWPPGNGISDR